MTRWEYKEFFLNIGNTDVNLNVLGSDGWEVVSVERLLANGRMFVLKRPLHPAPDTDDLFRAFLAQTLTNIHKEKMQQHARTCRICGITLEGYNHFCVLHACDRPFCTEASVGNARCRKHTVETWRCHKSRSATQRLPCENSAYATEGFCSEHTCDYENCYAERLEGELVCGAHAR